MQENSSYQRRNNEGFSLIEIILVIAVLCLLASVSPPREEDWSNAYTLFNKASDELNAGNKKKACLLVLEGKEEIDDWFKPKTGVPWEYKEPLPKDFLLTDVIPTPLQKCSDELPLWIKNKDAYLIRNH